MCLFSKEGVNKKYTATKKNGGVIPHCDDERKKRIRIGCGKCIECTRQRARGWQVRLMEEIKERKDGNFVTLTFSTESLMKLRRKIKGLSGYELDNEIATVAVRLFLERWRKKYGKSVRHWLITELGHGETEHLHIHGIIWTTAKEDISKIWSYGHVTIGNGSGENYVNERTVNYIIKYVTKVDEEHKEYKPKILTSSGIGANYTKSKNAERNKYKSNGETKETYKAANGQETILPTYYRNKLYTEEEREKLWTEKMDAGIIYVCGEKVDISESTEEYDKLIEHHRNRNRMLGYGDDKVNQERREYENRKREEIMEKRVEKANYANDKEREFWENYFEKNKE